jgi:hypothetical protein
LPVQERGNGDRDGIDQVEHWLDIGERSGATPGGDGLSLLGTGIGDRDKLDVGHRREDPRVVLSEVTDTDNTNS